MIWEQERQPSSFARSSAKMLRLFVCVISIILCWQTLRSTTLKLPAMLLA